LDKQAGASKDSWVVLSGIAESERVVIWLICAPRVAAAALVGAGLALMR